MAHNFHRLATLAAALEASSGSGESQIDALAFNTGWTRLQLAQLLDEAASARLIHRSNGAWALTDSGRSLGAAVIAEEADAIGHARERFRPYLEYVPKEWMPDNPE